MILDIAHIQKVVMVSVAVLVAESVAAWVAELVAESVVAWVAEMAVVSWRLVAMVLTEVKVLKVATDLTAVTDMVDSADSVDSVAATPVASWAREIRLSIRPES